jgi:hypothetical protein
MLLIQNIRLSWDKNERGAKGEDVRRSFPPAYPVGHQLFGEAVVQNLYFYQEEDRIMDYNQAEYFFMEKSLPRIGFTKEQAAEEAKKRIEWTKKHQYQSYPSIDALNLANLSVCAKENQVEITFFYDEQRSGVPVRRGHNKDFLNPDSRFYQKDNLNETAFILGKNQYGRIIWNERKVDYDQGTWYYEFHIYNLIYLTENKFPDNIFLQAEPDYIYRQLARLY